MNRKNDKLKIRERVFKIWYLSGDRYKTFAGWFKGFCRICFSVTFFLFIIVFLFYIGFSNSEENSVMLRSMFRILFIILFFSKFLPEILQTGRKTVISITFWFRSVIDA